MEWLAFHRGPESQIMSDDEITELASKGFCSVAVAARHLGICKSLVYREMEAGRLGYIKYKRRRLIPRRAVQRLAGEMLRDSLAESDAASNALCGAAHFSREN